MDVEEGQIREFGKAKEQRTWLVLRRSHSGEISCGKLLSMA